MRRIQRELTERALELLNLSYTPLEGLHGGSDSEYDSEYDSDASDDGMSTTDSESTSNQNNADNQNTEDTEYTTMKQTHPSHYFILDIGCGSGLSSQLLDEHGYQWAGVDISADMLRIARMQRNSHGQNGEQGGDGDEDGDGDESEDGLSGDLFEQDIGQGLGYRPGSFDGAIRYVSIHH